MFFFKYAHCTSVQLKIYQTCLKEISNAIFIKNNHDIEREKIDDPTFHFASKSITNQTIFNPLLIYLSLLFFK